MNLAHVQRSPQTPLIVRAPTRQDIAIVVCGGGDPFEEYVAARKITGEAGRNVTIFAGNDMIQQFPDHIDHAVTLHPDKLQIWMPGRKANGFPDIASVWCHRPYGNGVTEWTRDWQGSTGLFAVKVARELGFVHIVLCGVHMSEESNHFVRKTPWKAASGFKRGWLTRLPQLKPYVRSFGGWTRQELGAPTVEWLQSTIEDRHANARPVGGKA